MRVIDRAVRVGVGAVILLAWLAVTAPSAEAASVDLSALVLSKIDGYDPAPPGVGASGPLTKEQFVGVPIDPDDVDDITSSRISTFARTFVSPEGRIALIIAIDGRSVRGAERIEVGARLGATDIGPDFPVPGVDHAFRVVAPPEKAAGAHAQQVFFRTGQVAFFVTVAEMELSPTIESEVLRVTAVQKAAVPAEIAAATDDGSDALDVDLGRLVAIGTAGALQVAVVVLLVVVLVRRRSPPPAQTAWAGAPPAWSPPPAAWSPSPAPWGPPAASPPPPPPPAWPAPQQGWG